MNKNKIYTITWRDHYSTEGFFDPDNLEIVEEVILTSVGYFIASDAHYYHFARTIGEDTCADIMSILREQIITLEEID